MIRWSWWRTVLVLGALPGMLLPVAGLAAPPAPLEDAAAPQQQRVDDVRLDSAGTLHGVIVNAQAAPVEGVIVALRAAGRKPVIAQTDSRGHFTVAGLQGGVYHLATAKTQKLLRVWPAHAAPPGAMPQATLLWEGEVVRGQMPLESFFGSDAFIVAGMVAAMIAIPIAVHNSHDAETPGSP